MSVFSFQNSQGFKFLMWFNFRLHDLKIYNSLFYNNIITAYQNIQHRVVFERIIILNRKTVVHKHRDRSTQVKVTMIRYRHPCFRSVYLWQCRLLGNCISVRQLDKRYKKLSCFAEKIPSVHLTARDSS